MHRSNVLLEKLAFNVWKKTLTPVRKVHIAPSSLRFSPGRLARLKREQDILNLEKSLREIKNPTPAPVPESTLKKVLPLFGIGLGVSAGGALTAEGIEKINKGMKKKKNFEKMLAANPELRRNQEAIRPYFNSMYHFSPEVAGDPLAAGAFVKRMYEFKDIGLPLQDIQTLSDIRSKQVKVKGAPKGLLSTMRGSTDEFAKLPMKGFKIND